MRKTLSLVITMLLLTGTLLAQTRVITGKVTDDKGGPVPNASVIIKGTNTGTTTNGDGAFSITVPATAKTLVISAVGQGSAEIAITSKNIVDVSLKNLDKELQEVVVVGYGTQKKSSVTANITTVKGAALADKPAPSFDASLGGRAAGVQITVPNGVVNNPPVFRIRGTNSINLSSYPLIVIDGIPTFTGDVSSANAAANPLASVNPSDIESMDILKDAAATAIYGSRGANGVVLITTKKGKRGKSKVTYDGWAGVSKATRLWDMLNADEYMLVKNEGLKNAKSTNYPGFLPTNGPDGKPINTDWYDYAYRNGFSHSHNVAVSGGTDNTTYYFSAGYTDQQGIVIKNSFNRKNIRFNVDNRISKILSVGLNANYSNELNKASISSGSLPGQAFSSAGLARLALALPPNISPYNNDGTYNVSGAAIGKMNNVEGINFYNPVPLIDHNYSNAENDHIQGNVYIQLKPIADLTIRTNYGIDYLNVDNRGFTTPLNGDGYPGGSTFGLLNKMKRWVWTTTAQYDKTFFDKHTISVLAGTEQQGTNTESYGINRTNLSDPFYTNLQGGWLNQTATGMGIGENYLWSGFSRLNYDFDRKYFLTGTFRRDGYSAFAEGLEYGNFYSVSAGWDVSQEKFFTNLGIDKVVNSLRLRGSYGTSGNISGIGNFASYSFYSAGTYNGQATLAFSQAGNKELTWETSKKTDIGFTFGLFNDKITGEFAYYKNDIDGLLLNVSQSPSTGMPNSPLMNIGEMYNKGIEVTLNATPVSNKNFRWNTSFNFSTNKNMVTKLAPGVPFVTNATGLETVNITKPGYSLGYLYLIPTEGVDPQTGRRIFVNANNDRLLYDHAGPTGAKYTYMKDGSPAPAIDLGRDARTLYQSTPKFYGGFDNTFSYKKFDLNVLLTYQGGFYVYNGTQATIRDQRFWNSEKAVLNRWQKPGDVTEIPRLVFGDNVSNGSANPISDNVQKGDFVKLRNVALGYTFDQKALSKVGLSTARMYVSGQNLAVLTAYNGPDPEVSTNGNGNGNQGVDRNSVGNAITFTVGLTLGF
ncbi:TonB-dependent receptor [Paraflavitalea sp. CAU 1676]|uniref:SusC/RagA family TonB-linked outer membrane protein n=1 Tax=Paraflavitalea sp. CAU 1676 TaxID=3032598 RepID=UPI0023DCD27A|nr:TonB-dependent receptor [Paraflavitalea sp. CAU 1676]MDF2192496.1 TonB-dependent receptor [Paraflavitalea sp. CAU 1676]